MKVKNKFKVFLIILAVILTLSAVSVKLSEEFIIRKVTSATKNTVNIGSISFSLPALVILRQVAITNRFIPISLREISIRPVFTLNAFAFSGPGGITISGEERDMKVKGSVSGNFKQGELNIKQTSIDVENLGSFEVKGLLEKWGKESVSLNINLNGTRIEDVNELLDINIPFSGKATGTVLLDFVQNDPAKKAITFDVVVKELSMEKGSNFTAFVKGVYAMSEGRTDISDGRLVNAQGGQILFKGYLDRENFNFIFESENMPLEEFLKFIPEEIRKKYNLSITGGSASMKDFNIIKIKKKSC